MADAATACGVEGGAVWCGANGGWRRATSDSDDSSPGSCIDEVAITPQLSTGVSRCSGFNNVVPCATVAVATTPLQRQASARERRHVGKW